METLRGPLGTGLTLSGCREAQVALRVTALTPGEVKYFLKGNRVSRQLGRGQWHLPAAELPALLLAGKVVVSWEPHDVRSQVEGTAVAQLCQRLLS